MKRFHLSVLVIAAATAAGCGSSGGGSGSDNVAVPNLKGTSVRAAEAKLLNLGVSDALKVDPLDRNHCIITSQRETKVASSGTVHVTCKVAVPKLVGKTYDAADNSLQKLGLDDSYPDNVSDTTGCKVARQSKRGRVLPNVTVKLGLKCAPSQSSTSSPGSSSPPSPTPPSSPPSPTPPSTPSPTPPSSSGTGSGLGHPGVCQDGSPTYSAGRPGACSHHGGLAG